MPLSVFCVRCTDWGERYPLFCDAPCSRNQYTVSIEKILTCIVEIQPIASWEGEGWGWVAIKTIMYYVEDMVSIPTHSRTKDHVAKYHDLNSHLLVLLCKENLWGFCLISAFTQAKSFRPFR